jgi:hypothetical protein
MSEFNDNYSKNVIDYSVETQKVMLGTTALKILSRSLGCVFSKPCQFDGPAIANQINSFAEETFCIDLGMSCSSHSL